MTTLNTLAVIVTENIFTENWVAGGQDFPYRDKSPEHNVDTQQMTNIMADRKNAFIDQYRKEPMFEDSLDEFDDARNVAQELLEEYQACERADYIVSLSSLSSLPFPQLKLISIHSQ